MLNRKALFFLIVFAPCFAADAPPGAQLYSQHCAACHDNPQGRIPSRDSLKQRSAKSIYTSITSGVMKQQAGALKDTERKFLAAWLGSTLPVAADATKLVNRCPSNPNIPFQTTAPNWTNWGGLNNWRHQQSTTINATNVAKLKLKWAFGFEGTANLRSQPAVYGGRIFAGGDDGVVHSLDASTGCTYWTTETTAPIRSGMSVGAVGGQLLLFYGDTGGYIQALDAQSGRPVWRTRADEHPATLVSSTPVLHEGRLYAGVSSYEEVTPTQPSYVCCTFRGSILALDAATGKQIWKTYTISQPAVEGKPNKSGKPTKGPSGAGVWSAPTIDAANRVLYAATGDNYSDPPTQTSDALLALSLTDGKLLWSKQFTPNDSYNTACNGPGPSNCPDSNGPDHDFGSSPILINAAGGKQIVLMAQKSGQVYAVDPAAEGKILWQARPGKGGYLGGIQWGPAADGTNLYVAVSDLGFRSRGELNPAQGGGIHAFRIRDGELLWTHAAEPCGDRPHCSPSQSAAVSSAPGVVFSGSVDGHMRAYSAAGGKVLWDFDTARSFETVNRIAAKGGSMDVAGPVLIGNMIFVVSGYAQWGGLPGNVLLAFEIPQ